MTDAYEEGRKAGYRGLPRHNPYYGVWAVLARQSKACEDWFRGYQDGWNQQKDDLYEKGYRAMREFNKGEL